MLSQFNICFTSFRFAFLSVLTHPLTASGSCHSKLWRQEWPKRGLERRDWHEEYRQCATICTRLLLFPSNAVRALEACPVITMGGGVANMLSRVLLWGPHLR